MTEVPDVAAPLVMVVDDDASMRLLIRRMLQRFKIDHIVEASGGDEALRYLEAARSPVDLVICDWNMPGMSGVELYGQVARLRPDLPFLLVTGRADDLSLNAALEAGVTNYIVKPISRQELRAKIASLLTGKVGVETGDPSSPPAAGRA
jgi:two-component system, chemotaxis family, chemotaxis protein CheY